MFKKISLFFLLLNVFIISAQNEVKGIVIDQSTNSPIIGATVVIKNLTRGTTTDFDGNFTLTNVPEGSTLIFSYLGFVTQELVLSSNEIISISLKPSISELSEVVLVGYGAQAKKK